MTRIASATMLLANLLFLPGRVVEEGLHALAALAAGGRVQVVIDPARDTAETRVLLDEQTPTWVVRSVHLLPEAVAAVAGLAVIGWWIVSGPLWWPETASDWILLSVLGAQYLAVAVPSAADTNATGVGGENDA